MKLIRICRQAETHDEIVPIIAQCLGNARSLELPPSACRTILGNPHDLPSMLEPGLLNPDRQHHPFRVNT